MRTALSTTAGFLAALGIGAMVLAGPNTVAEYPVIPDIESRIVASYVAGHVTKLYTPQQLKQLRLYTIPQDLTKMSSFDLADAPVKLFAIMQTPEKEYLGQVIYYGVATETYQVVGAKCKFASDFRSEPPCVLLRLDHPTRMKDFFAAEFGYLHFMPWNFDGTFGAAYMRIDPYHGTHHCQFNFEPDPAKEDKKQKGDYVHAIPGIMKVTKMPQEHQPSCEQPLNNATIGIQ